MKVVILSQNDPLYTHYFFKKFVKTFDRQFDLQGVFLLMPMKDSLSDLIKRTWDFYGPVNFVRMGLIYVWIKLMEKLGRPVTPLNLLNKHKIRAEEIANVNDKQFVERLEQMQPDIIVSVSCPQIFKQRLLAVPSVAALNIHSGKLPFYKGLFPNFWQMLNRETTSTVTIHEMVAKVDEGKIITEAVIPITKSTTLTQLIKNTKEAAVDELYYTIEMYKQGKVAPYVNKGKPGYYKFPGREASKQFREKGLKIL